MRFVEQNPHQLRDCHRWMCIVELDRDFIGKRTPVEVVNPEAPHEIGERAGDQKIFLYKPQSLPHARVVVGIQYAGQRFGLERLSQRADEIAAAEFLKVEIIVRRCCPEAEGIDGLAAVADHGTIERDANQNGWLADHGTQGPAAHLERAVELYLHRLVWATDLPWVRATKPVVWKLMLPAVLYRLFEDAVFVAQAIPHSRDLHRRH